MSGNGHQRPTAKQVLYVGLSIEKGKVIVLDKKTAVFLRYIDSVLKESSTWGDLKKNLPQSESRRIQEFLDGENTFDDFLGQNAEKGWSREYAFEEFKKLPLEERCPLDHDPYRIEKIPGYYDGEWPPWPAQLMCGILPEEIQLKYGGSQNAVLNGPFMNIPPQKKEDLIRDLEGFGYKCIEDQELMDEIQAY